MSRLQFRHVHLRLPVLLLAPLVLSAGLTACGDVSSPRGSPGLPGPSLPAPSALTSLGEVDPEWAVRSLDGTELKWRSLRGKVVVVNIWATWCGPCVAEMPSIQALHQSMRDSDTAFLIVSKEPESTVRGFVDKKQWTLPFYVAQGDMPAVFKTDRIPATFVANRRGEVVFRHIGSANWNSDACRDFLRSVP